MAAVYLSLGSNLGERERFLQDAIALLGTEGVRLTGCSSVYETEPRDLPDQPRFLNLVLEAESDLEPAALLAHVQEVEARLGRRRTVPKGPRTIDVDILLYGSEAIDTPQLVIPHPRLGERRFVLEPLADLAPDLRHPATGQTVREMLAATLDQDVRQVAFRPALPGR